ncbi:MAG: hypothetical protein FWC50_01515 [Planctomycetaceae bacterium]|nr:hypothetical protein [Planctomycetaceae bacterium]
MDLTKNNTNPLITMTTIARIIVTEADLRDKHKLFMDFITASKKLLTKGEKHQFVLLPAGFLTFDANDLTGVPLSEPQEKSAKQQWNAEIENLKEQALAEFHRAFDAVMLKKLKSVAQYLVIGINSQHKQIQFVLVYDLQSNRPLHWTGKTYPTSGEKHNLIKMPIDSHFMKVKIGGKRVAVFGCHDLSIFNPRHQKHFSPFDDERKGAKRQANTASGRIKCPFIDATLDFNPEIMLQLPHTEGTWAAKWTTLNKWLKRKNKGEGLQHFATGLKRNPNKQYSLSGTQHGDVVNFAGGTWVTK